MCAWYREAVHTDNWIWEECNTRSRRQFMVTGAFYFFAYKLVSARWGHIEPSDLFWGAGLLLLGLVLTVNAVRAFRVWRKPETHPTIERILRRGDDLLRTSTRVLAELRQPIVKTWRWEATKTYLVKSTFLTFDVSRFDELVWICKQEVDRSAWIIPHPFGAYDEARFQFASHKLVLRASEKKVDAVLAHAVQVTPWAMYGDNRQVRRLFDQEGYENSAANTWKRAAHDMKAVLYLTEAEAAAGLERVLPVHYLAPCPICAGANWSCAVCKGSGAAVLLRALSVAVPAGAERGYGMTYPGGGIPKTPYADAGTLRVWFLIE